MRPLKLEFFDEEQDRVTHVALSVGIENSNDEENTKASWYSHVCYKKDHQRGETALSAKRDGPKSHLQLSHRDAGSGPSICHLHPRNRTAANHEAHLVDTGPLQAVARRVVDLVAPIAVAVSGVVPFDKDVGVGGGTVSAVAVAIAPTSPPPPPLPAPPSPLMHWRRAGRPWRRRRPAARRRRRRRRRHAPRWMPRRGRRAEQQNGRSGRGQRQRRKRPRTRRRRRRATARALQLQERFGRRRRGATTAVTTETSAQVAKGRITRPRPA